MNTFNQLDMQKYSKPPLRKECKKYTMNAASMNKVEDNSRSYRKIPNDIISSSIHKQNMEFNPNAKSSKNIQVEAKASHARKHSRSFLGKSQVTDNYLTSTCYVPRQKQQRSRSRWEMKEYNNKNDYSQMNIKNECELETATTPSLINKYSMSSPQTTKPYLKFNSVNTTCKYESQFTNQYKVYTPSRFESTSRAKDIQQNKIQYGTLELKNENNKSSKNIPFYEKIKTVNFTSPSFKAEEQSYFNNTFSFANATNTNQFKSNSMAESMGGNRFKQLYDSYDLKSTALYNETQIKHSLSVNKLQKKVSSKQQSQKQPQLDDFFIGQCKGEGRFGKVYMAIHKKTGFLCALKKVKKDSVKYMIDQFIQQIKIQLYLNHPKLVKMYGYFSDAEYFYMLIEYMEDGSLYSLMKKNKKFEEPEAIQKLTQICEGIKEMHEHNIVHRDLKPQNVVISHGVCKICDFGWAACCEDRRQTYCGTLDYVCPQIIQGNSYDSSVDIWCIGVLAYQLMCGKAPFYDISRKKTMQKIKSCKIQSFPSHLSKKSINFIEMILTKDPDSRVGIQQLLDSEFLRCSKK